MQGQMLSASCRMTDRPVLVALKANFGGTWLDTVSWFLTVLTH